MKASVVLSTYNGEKYLIEQMDSLKNQTFPLKEVLISDDCSTDDTVDIIRNYISTNHLDNWSLSVNEQNKGWRQNFMDLIGAASGDVIFTCDQDDIWNTDKIEKMMSVMKNNDEISVLVSRYTEFFENGSIRLMPQKDLLGNLIKQEIVHNFTAIPYPGCTYAIRRSFFVIAKKYWESDFPHDSLLWRTSMFSEGLYILNESLINMRKHTNSTFTLESKLSKNKNTKRNSLDYEQRVFEGMINFINTEKIVSNKEEKLALIYKCIEWNRIRKKMYDKKSPFAGIFLVKYVSFYPNFKRYVADWIWTFKKQ